MCLAMTSLSATAPPAGPKTEEAPKTEAPKASAPSLPKLPSLPNLEDLPKPAAPNASPLPQPQQVGVNHLPSPHRLSSEMLVTWSDLGPISMHVTSAISVICSGLYTVLNTSSQDALSLNYTSKRMLRADMA